jgi:predicted metal-binding protein
MTENDAIIEEFIYNYPVCEFYSIKHSDLVFSEKVRYICEHECDHYNKSWACPPAIPSIEECIKECDEYDNVFLFTTVAEVADPLNLTETLAARKDHERMVREIRGEFRKRFSKVMALSSGSLNCEVCAYPDEPCRHPKERTSTIESHGILIIQTAEAMGISYDCGNNMVTYFALIFYS